MYTPQAALTGYIMLQGQHDELKNLCKLPEPAAIQNLELNKNTYHLIHMGLIYASLHDPRDDIRKKDSATPIACANRDVLYICQPSTTLLIY